MICHASSRGFAEVGAVMIALATIVCIVFFSAHKDANAQLKDEEIAETFVLSSGAEKATVFRVLANRIGIVPADDQPFDDVVESVKKTGLDIIATVEDEQLIIAGTSAPAGTFAALQEEASKLMATTGEVVRWAAPVVLTGQVDGDDTADTRDILLPTNVVIVKVRPNVKEATVRAVAERFGLRFLQRNPVDDREYYFQSPENRDDINVFSASRAFLGLNIFEYALPNFLMFVELRQSVVDDEHFDDQWPLHNTGQGGGMIDADIDVDLAWSHFGLGKAGTIIAVIDGGFDLLHDDLMPNFYVNPAENAKNGLDDDGNGYVDDLKGWDFRSNCWHTPILGCGDADPTGGDNKEGRHGTMTSGTAAAAGDNALGVSGSCPNCALLPLRVRSLHSAVAEQVLAIAYAQAAGADIISISWGYRLLGFVTDPIENAIHNATAAGSAVFFAMSTTGEGYVNDCVELNADTGADLSSLDDVIGVSASNNVDTRTPAGYGDCMDVLAPTDNALAGVGTLWPVSTDLSGPAGYNTNHPIDECGSTEFQSPPDSELSYTFCANGTSYAAPLTAGIAGLMESLDDTLTPLRHKQVLQDTADKIEPAVAAYDPDTGFSSPTVAPTPQSDGSPGGVGSTHGFGRVNAYEAVRLVAPATAGGRGDIDVFLRDNYLDWGNTEQPSNVLMDNPRGVIPHDESVSIKIDAPDYEEAPPTTPQEFAAFPNEEPRAEATNRVYVLVRNRGGSDATNVTVKLLWAFVGEAPPALPSNFWTEFPGDPEITAPWTVIDTQTLPTVEYSGASIATQQGDGAQIVTFDFQAPALNPSVAAFRDYSLFAVVESSEDPVSEDSRASLVPDDITPSENNITLRKVSLQDPPN